ncbi:hypothetical protein MTR67_035004 [Solanum verrucosum]|uniref:Uncharacterized protein n=1 Tax=Solanum verrucosum TaxID=315347 RepID=A0AAF0U9E3_SOLVR|nr:hypothetical protein MTR67_035004 [Solanum verrucosum]
MSQLLAQVEPKLFEKSEDEYAISSRADNDKDLAFGTQSGKITVGTEKVNDETNNCKEEKDIVKEKRSIQSLGNDMPKEGEEIPKQSTTEELQKTK